VLPQPWRKKRVNRGAPQDREIGVIFGTRPEAIKLFPVIQELRNAKGLRPLVVFTGQHSDLASQVLDELGIEPDFDLRLMEPNQQPCEFLARATVALSELLSKQRPDFVLVQGDTTSTLAGALGAYYCRIPAGHVEAGLRTPDKYSPFPEEMNRRLVTAIVDLHFAPTEQAGKNLLREGIAEDKVFVTGNTVVDALQKVMGSPHKDADIPGLPVGSGRLLVLTLHRRETFGEPLRGILTALKEVLEERRDVELVFPVHPNPAVKENAVSILGNGERAHLVEPLPYPAFLRLLNKSYMIVTDSGGIQEEAPVLGKPTLVVRQFTERGEAIEAGAAILVGTDGKRIKREICRLLDDSALYERMRPQRSLFGDGKAAERIVREVARLVLES
jgi:UDP-N-acetylglucosamine 2-epimerase (non-hydrolysing)